MTPRILLTLFAALALPASAAVTVTYGEPDRWRDAGDRSSDPRKVAQDLAGFLKGLGDRYLPDRSLAIEIVDLDRAGRPRMNLPTEIRVMTAVDMPCVELRWALEGAAPKAERVCDSDYLQPLRPRDNEHDPLVYEKRMLENWFRERFAPNAKR